MTSPCYEVPDFACGVTDAQGQLVVQNNAVTLFTGTFGLQVQSMLREFAGTIADGDVYMTNDPYGGGTHTTDVALIKPIFWREAWQDPDRGARAFGRYYRVDFNSTSDREPSAFQRSVRQRHRGTDFACRSTTEVGHERHTANPRKFGGGRGIRTPKGPAPRWISSPLPYQLRLALRVQRNRSLRYNNGPAAEEVNGVDRH